ncbi:MAG: hypothetical protein IJ740_18325, partial [Ruminococcus sp.]|nr:hypothetical protein [Ruminococcus sp.]
IPESQNADLRLFFGEKEVGIQIRISGKQYNIFEYDNIDEFMGIDMIKKIASNVSCNYVYLLGCNTYQIFIDR